MIQRQISNNLRHTLRISLLLISISTFTIFALGISLLNIHKENQSLENFLANAVNVQPNFEKSLLIYTEKTKDVIAYLLELRPDNEKDYVQFISDIENIGRNMGLEIELQSSEDSFTPEKDFILYELSFLGTMQNLQDFLDKLEKSNYYTGIQKAEYRNLNLLVDENSPSPKNISLIIKLFIKK